MLRHTGVKWGVREFRPKARCTGVVSPRGAGVVLKVLSGRVLTAFGFRYPENQSFDLTPHNVTAPMHRKVYG